MKYIKLYNKKIPTDKGMTERTFFFIKYEKNNKKIVTIIGPLLCVQSNEIKNKTISFDEDTNKIIEINPTCASAQVGYVYSLRLALILALVAVLLRTILS